MINASRELMSIRRQALHFTGLKAKLDDALQQAAAQASGIFPGLDGIAVFVPAGQESSSIIAAGYHQKSTPENDAFGQAYLHRRLLPRDKTAAGNAMDGGSGFYESQMRNQRTLCIVEEFAGTPIVFQGAFSPEAEIGDADLQKFEQILTGPQKGPPVRDSAQNLVSAFIEDLSDQLGARPSVGAQAIFMGYDITGYKSLLDVFHEASVIDLMHDFHGRVEKIMQENEYGFIFRFEGDGGLIISQSSAEQMLMAARDITNAYDLFKTDPATINKKLQSTTALEALKTTFIKCVLACGYADLRLGKDIDLDMVRSKDRLYARVSIESPLALTQISQLLEKAVRDKNDITFTPDFTRKLKL